jgi:hypothetical protein
MSAVTRVMGADGLLAHFRVTLQKRGSIVSASATTMVRPTKPPASVVQHPSAGHASIELIEEDGVGLLNIRGVVDEGFLGFGAIPPSVKSLIINLTNLTQMTSFGLRQWMNAFEPLPKSFSNIYLLGCPTFFVDQLVMVLSFGAGCQVLTAVAPFMCSVRSSDRRTRPSRSPRQGERTRAAVQAL